MTYRRELDGLSDELWAATVRIALQRERWFPTVAALLAYASEAASSVLPSWKALPASTRTPEERAEAIKRGIDVFRSELKRLGIEAPDKLVETLAREPGCEG